MDRNPLPPGYRSGAAALTIGLLVAGAIACLLRRRGSSRAAEAAALQGADAIGRPDADLPDGLLASPARERAPAAATALTFGLALGARLLGAAAGRCLLRGRQVPPDTAEHYFPLARSLAAGRGYLHPTGPEAATRIAPGYPFCLSLLIDSDEEALPLRRVLGWGALGRAVACAVLGRLAGRLFGRRAGMTAALLYALDPWEAVWTGIAIKEAVAVPLFLLALERLSLLEQHPDLPHAAAAGACAGAAYLARFPSVALLPLGWWQLATLSGGGRAPALPLAERVSLLLGYSAAAGAVMAPWLGFTYRARGSASLTHLPLGQLFVHTNAPGAPMVTGGYTHLKPEDRPDAERLREYSLRFAALSPRMKVLASLAHMLARPRAGLRRLGRRLWNMWRPTYASHRWGSRLLLGVPYSASLLLAGLGMARARRKHLPCRPVAAPLGLYALIHLAFFGEIRNRQYLTPLLHAFAALALVPAEAEAAVTHVAEAGE